MASYRNISMDFWTDSKVVDDFTPEDRYIYLYCMTNPHTNLCGCYEVSIKQIANETGYHSQAHTSHESGVSASGCVAPSPSRHRRAEGGEMRCNRRRRQKVL